MTKIIRIDLFVEHIEINQLYDIMVSFNDLYNLFINKRYYGFSDKILEETAICLLPKSLKKNNKEELYKVTFEIVNFNDFFEKCTDEFVKYFKEFIRKINKDKIEEKDIFFIKNHLLLNDLMKNEEKIYRNSKVEDKYKITSVKLNYTFSSLKEYMEFKKIKIYFLPNNE